MAMDNAIIFFHLVTAFTALILSPIILLLPKGTATHKALGRLWASLMMITALASFFIHEIQTWGAFSFIHILSAIIVITLIYAVISVRKGRIIAHEQSMKGAMIGLCFAFVFALLPGRQLNVWITGYFWP